MIVHRDFLYPYELSIEIRETNPIGDTTRIEVRGEVIGSLHNRPGRDCPELPRMFVQTIQVANLYLLDEKKQIVWMINEALYKLDKQVDYVWGSGRVLKEELKKLI